MLCTHVEIVLHFGWTAPFPPLSRNQQGGVETGLPEELALTHEAY